MDKIIVILSGGMDSTTLLYKLIAEGYEIPEVLSFNYNQRHVKELTKATTTVKSINERFSKKILHRVIDVPFGALATNSSLTANNVDVPEGHYADESMKLTVVPNRNMIFLSLAASRALTINAKLAVGVHAGDHTIYPDCRIDFIEAAEAAIKIGNWNAENFDILTPFLHISKGDIVKEGLKAANSLNLDYVDIYKNTWSCYKGGDISCGKCGTCVERLEAFAEAGLVDPLPYSK